MAFADTRYQPISTPMGDFGQTCSLSTIIIKKKKREYLLEECCSVPSVYFKRLVESMTSLIETVVAAVVSQQQPANTLCMFAKLEDNQIML